MSNTNQPPQIAQVIIAVDTGAYRPSTIEIAVEFAASTQTRLEGLFIEDTDLLNLAGLPCTREICLTTGQLRTLDTQQLQRSWEQTSNRFRQSLAQKAEQSVVQWSYAALRGRRQDLLCGEYAKAAFLILEQPARHPVRKQAATTAVKRILVLDDHSANMAAALNLLSAKFAGFDIELSVFREPDAATPAWEARWQQAEGEGRRRRLRHLNAEQTEAFMRDDNRSPDYILAAHAIDAALLAEAVSSSDCPLIIVS